MGTSDMYSQYPTNASTTTNASHNVMYASPCYTAGAPGVGAVTSQFGTCTDSFRRQDIFPGSMTNPTTAADLFSSYHDKFYYPTTHHSQVGQRTLTAYKYISHSLASCFFLPENAMNENN